MAYDWITDALEDTWGRISQVLASRSERDFDALTCCPGWSVRDVVNHVTGTEMFLGGAPRPEATGPRPAHVLNELGAGNEAFVAARRHLGADEVRADFREATQATLARLRALDDTQWEAPTRGPLGERPLHQFIETRTLDCWIHLQDIRDALLEPADDHGPGEEIVVNTFEAALPFVWAKRVAPPEGSLLRVNLAGSLARSVQVEVRQGRGTAVAASDVTPLVELSTAVELFWRVMAGRINAEAFLAASATDVRGDRETARRLAASMNVVP